MNTDKKISQEKKSVKGGIYHFTLINVTTDLVQVI